MQMLKQILIKKYKDVFLEKNEKYKNSSKKSRTDI